MAEVRTTVYSPGTMLYQFVNFLIGIVELSLAFRFFLRLMGANPNTDFVAFIYRATAPLMAPFQAIFGSVSVAQGGVIEWSILVAMLVYAIIGYIINEVIALVTVHRTTVQEI